MSLLLLILSVHFLADFHLWPGSPDVKKHPCFRCLLPHFGMYSLVLGLIFILCVSFPSAVIAWMFIILSHFITDVLTFHRTPWPIGYRRRPTIPIPHRFSLDPVFSISPKILQKLSSPCVYKSRFFRICVICCW